MNIKHIKKILLAVIPLIMIVIIFFVIYGSGQQIIRQSANDPQIQLANDISDKLEIGANPAEIIPKDSINVEKSLSPFVIIYDNEGKPILSSGVLNGNIPNPPSGVFDYTRRFGEERFTWQPQRNVRIATVLKRFNGNNPGFVLAGRSLKEIEERESYHLLISFIGLAGSLILTLLGIFLYNKINQD